MEYNVPLYIYVNLARLNCKWQRTFALKKKISLFFSGKDLLGPLLRQGEQEQTTNPLAGSLSEAVGPGSFSRGVRVECVQGSGRRVAAVRCPPPRWPCVQGASAAPYFCSGRSSFDSGLQKRQSLRPLYIFCPKFALTVHTGSYF